MQNRSPYDDIEPMQRWSTISAAINSGAFDPQGDVRFTIDANTRVSSGGSCFAVRIAERLRASGLRYLTTEAPPSWMTPEQIDDYGYLPFSVRSGLIFTPLQLRQLFERAYGHFVPIETAWQRGDVYVDPFRPRIVRDGFESVAELEDDRRTHLAATRRMFETVDVFIFTLGLTETWVDRRDGAAYPIAPGIVGGTYDPQIHEMQNHGVARSCAHLEAFLTALRAVNPRVRVILTVSPIPLGATMEKQNVARATTYSKSVLRVVAEEMHRAHDFVDYFASYEMVSQSFGDGDAFDTDRRHLKAGVADRVLDTFFAHYVRSGAAIARRVPVEMPALAVRACDEDVFAS